MTNGQVKDWDRRVVDYDQVHGDDSKAFDFLTNRIIPRNGMFIGDIMGGYGAVSKALLNYCKANNISVGVVLSDFSQVQLNRSLEFLASSEGSSGCVVSRVNSDSRKLDIPNDSLECAVIKFGLHEVPKEDQPRVLSEAYRVLTPNGRLFLWVPCGSTPTQTRYFGNIVKKKDELAGYEQLAKDRYFAHRTEIKEMLSKTGFRGVETIYSQPLIYRTAPFRDSDFCGNDKKFEAWNRYIQRIISKNVKSQIKLLRDDEDRGNIEESHLRGRLIYENDKPKDEDDFPVEEEGNSMRGMEVHQDYGLKMTFRKVIIEAKKPRSKF